MKKIVLLKAICLALVLCMILPAIVACDTGNRGEDNTIEKSTTEEVTTEEPTTEEPATEEPTTEEPTTEEPTSEEPTVCEHEWKDATCEAPKTCLKCGETEGEIGEHSVAENGKCIYCDKPMRSTEGLIYEISDDGTYATLIDYVGTNSVVIIADEYKVLYSCRSDAWFTQNVNSANGIWIGDGFGNQYLFKPSKFSSEYNEEIGNKFGYVVKRGKPILTKLAISAKEDDENE